MFLSVSMPVYNCEKYLDECIQSVINQTDDDYELILVDDGSTDCSVEICEKWEKKYPERIRVIKKKNSGSLFTRRVCLEESKGEYIYIMDSDDYLTDKNAFSTIKDTILREKCDFLFFNCTANSDTGERLFDFPFSDGEVFQGDDRKIIRKYYLTNRGLKALWNKVFHRSLVDWDVDYSQFSEITSGTDCFQSTPIISNANKMIYLDKVLYFYRENQNSIVHTFKKTVFISSKYNFARMSEEAEKWGFDKEELREILVRQYMKIASTSAYKIRLIKDDKQSCINFLHTIGEDTLFNEYYDLSLTDSFARKIIVLLLHLKMYKLLFTLIRISNRK